MGNSQASSHRLDESVTATTAGITDAASPAAAACVLSEDPRSPTEGIRRTPIAIDSDEGGKDRTGGRVLDSKRLCSTPRRGGGRPAVNGSYKRFALNDSTNQTSDCSAAFSVAEELPSIDGADEEGVDAAGDDELGIPPADGVDLSGLSAGDQANSTAGSGAGLVIGGKGPSASRRSPLARLRDSLRSFRGSGSPSAASPGVSAAAAPEAAASLPSRGGGGGQQQPRMLLWRKQRAKYRQVPAEGFADCTAESLRSTVDDD